MSDDYAVQVSLSLPPSAQYAKGDMINFRGDSPEDVASLLESAINNGLLTKAVEAGKVYLAASGLGASAAPADAFNGSPAAAPPFAQGAASASSPATPAPMCAHGKRTWKDGGSWRAWFCPQPKNATDKCDPIWANPDGTPKG